MDLLLIHVPPAPERAYPLGLAYLAATARDVGVPVFGIDADLDGETVLFQRVRDPSVRWVGMTTFTCNQSRAWRIARRVKAERPDVILILGGPHATCLPEQALVESGADMVVLGEGEPALREILRQGNAPKWKSIPGVAFRERNALVTTPPRRRPVPIDSIPFPDRDFLPVHRYGHAMMAQAYPYATLVTSRGCTLACCYCPSPTLWNGGWRGRTPENILNEMQAVHRKHGIRHFILEDDHFMASGTRIRDFCRLLGREGGLFTWELSNGVPPEQIFLEQVPLLAQGGCVSLTLGLETRHLDEKVTGRKPYRKEYVRRLIRRCHGFGIFVGGYFLMGFPGETPKQIIANAADARDLPLDSAHFSILTPLPGTPVYRNQNDFRECRLPLDRLQAMQREAYLRFYLRPRIFQKVLGSVQKNPRLAIPLSEKFRETILDPIRESRRKGVLGTR